MSQIAWGSAWQGILGCCVPRARRLCRWNAAGAEPSHLLQTGGSRRARASMAPCWQSNSKQIRNAVFGVVDG
jgi:hypothetical protein